MLKPIRYILLAMLLGSVIIQDAIVIIMVGVLGVWNESVEINNKMEKM